MKLISTNRHILCFLLFLIATFSSTSLSYAIDKDKTYIILGDWMYAPYSFNNDKGEPDGFDINLVKEIMNIEGLKYEIQLMPWLQAENKMVLDQCDMIVGVTDNYWRHRYYMFTNSYIDINYCIVSHKDTKIENMQQLRKKRILTTDEDITTEIINSVPNNDIEVIYVENIENAILILSRGQYDAVICSSDIAKYVINKLEITNLAISDKSFGIVKAGITAKDPELIKVLNDGLAKLIKNGTYARLHKLWIDDANIDGNNFNTPLWIPIIFTIFLVAIIMVVLCRYQAAILVKKTKNRSEYLIKALNSGNLIVWIYDVKKGKFRDFIGKIFSETSCGIDEKIDKYIHPEDQNTLRMDMERAKNGSKSTGIVVRVKDFKNDTWRDVLITYDTICSKAGKVALIVGVGRDISDHLHKNKERQQLIISLQNAIEAADLSVCYFEVQETAFYKLENNAFIKSDMTYGHLLSYAHPSDKEAFDKCFHSVISAEEPSAKVVTRFKFDTSGTYQSFDNTLSALRDNKGNVSCVIFSQQNITERQLQIVELQDKIRSLNMAMAAGKIQSWRYDVSTKLLTTLFGQVHSIPDFSVGINRKRLHPNSLKEYDDLCDRIKNGNNDSKENIILRLRPHDSEDYHYFEYSMRLIRNKYGKLLSIYGISKDVTEDTLLQQQLKQYADKINFMLVSSKILSYNYDIVKDEITIASGGDYIDTFTAEQYVNRMVPEDREYVASFINKLKNKEINRFKELRRVLNVDSDSKYCYVEVYGAPIYDESNEIISYSGFRHDITELMETQQKLERAKADAEKTDKLKSVFLANMSHEIRTPLNAIVGFSDLLQDSEDKDERNVYMEIINTNTELLLRLISEILDLSKIESGLMDLNIERIDFDGFFDQQCQSLAQRCKNPNVKFDVQSPHNTLIAYIDKERIAQIMLNFTTNAIKYTSTGSIQIGYEQVDNGIKLWVKDTGIGIPKEKHCHIFQRFEKLDSFAQGTGLGLSICKAITDMIHGSIGFESDTGVGSTFWVWVPASEPENTLKE